MTVIKMSRKQAEEKKTPDLEPWVGIRTVALHLDFSRNKVAQMARDGIIPGIMQRSGKREYWRFKLSMVDAAWTKRAEAGAPTQRTA